jgi:hypothetical protein
MSDTVSLSWHPLESLDARFRANLLALETRDAELAERLRGLSVSRPLFIAARGDNVYLGRSGENGIELIADPVPPPSARALAARVFPNGLVTGPLAVSGLGYGWLWDCLSKLPCKVDVLPGHRPPIYLLAGDLEQLWAVLHVMDWRAMLAEARLPIFAGPDALEQFRQALLDDPTFPEPRGMIRVDSTVPAQDLNAFCAVLGQSRDTALNDLYCQLDAVYAPPTGLDGPDKFRSGRLRILGITSRYTTFLQHSMRDWLAALESLGHEVQLVIEGQDHQMLGAFGYAKGVLDFRPDLILVIDHYRRSIAKIPESVPSVMWVQDWLPNIFCDAAGAAQGPRDYCMGFGRLKLSQSHGYPAERFMSCRIGINEERFKPAVLSEADWARYGCDASYVSHASTPSDLLLKTALAKEPDPSAAKLLWDFHDRLIGDFQQGGCTHAEWQLKELLDQSIAQTGIEPSPAKVRDILWLFNHQVNNAIFRHQALNWVADLGIDLKLYGNNWDKHPTLGRFACGPADTMRDVPKICAASKINLQIIPHGTVHQRLLEGLVAGGFYLLRWVPGDEMGIAVRCLRDWCHQHGIGSESALRSIENAQVRIWIAECNALRADADGREFRLYDRLMEGGDAELTGRAGAVWPDQYSQIAFRSAAELEMRLTRYLSSPRERAQISAAMRAEIVENFTYLKISQRLLQFIATDLQSARTNLSAAA